MTSKITDHDYLNKIQKIKFKDSQDYAEKSCIKIKKKGGGGEKERTLILTVNIKLINIKCVI